MKKISDCGELIKLELAAECMDVKITTMRGYIQNGTVPGKKIGGRYYAFRDRWLEQINAN